ncbi:hypothetical protein [Geothrix sp. 21YS21S-4]|uniref:hypothetical protein n=1 Tax=Geothrix sp. 21YS21S-4 TaxID=3068889 RepID=UPI0027BAE2E9|nr:hypothetical protein [Geothrix sp. 21YS21S-4]
MTTAVSPSPRGMLFAAALGLGFGGVAFGWAEGSIALWGFGGACLLHAALSVNAWMRLREGLGNRGLERERLVLRAVGLLLRLLAAGMALTAGAALMGDRSAPLGSSCLALGGAGAVGFGLAWMGKRSQKGLHPTLDLDATVARVPMELALLLLAGGLASRWFAGADAAIALVAAVRLFWEGRALAKVSALPAAACGSCGSCGCG